MDQTAKKDTRPAANEQFIAAIKRNNSKAVIASLVANSFLANYYTVSGGNENPLHHALKEKENNEDMIYALFQAGWKINESK